jgi:hypothetical protein
MLTPERPCPPSVHEQGVFAVIVRGVRERHVGHARLGELTRHVRQFIGWDDTRSSMVLWVSPYSYLRTNRSK